MPACIYKLRQAEHNDGVAVPNPMEIRCFRVPRTLVSLTKSQIEAAETAETTRRETSYVSPSTRKWLAREARSTYRNCESSFVRHQDTILGTKEILESAQRLYQAANTGGSIRWAGLLGWTTGVTGPR